MRFLYSPGSKAYMHEVRQILYTEQRGKCAICSKPSNLKRLAVDHDHETGFVRGLLCYNCNSGLGQFHDNIITLEHAQAYLSTHGKRAVKPRATLRILPLEETTSPWVDEMSGKAI